MIYQDKEAEINFFNRLAKENINNQKESIEFVNEIFDIAPFLKQDRNLKILDAGCGRGLSTKKLADNGHYVIGVDVSPNMIDQLNIYASSNLKGVVGDLEDMSLFPKEYFDAVFCGHVLHHFPDLNYIIRNIHYWLKPNGRLFLVEPNGANPINMISHIAGKALLKFRPDLRSKIATKNETVYCFQDYKDVLEKKRQFKISFLYFYLVKPPFIPKAIDLLSILLALREFLAHIFYIFLPHKYKARMLIIEAVRI